MFKKKYCLSIDTSLKVKFRFSAKVTQRATPWAEQGVEKK